MCLLCIYSVRFSVITMISSYFSLTRGHLFHCLELNMTKIKWLVMLPRNRKALHDNTLAHSDYIQKKYLEDGLSTVSMELLFYFCIIPLFLKVQGSSSWNRVSHSACQLQAEGDSPELSWLGGVRLHPNPLVCPIIFCETGRVCIQKFSILEFFFHI